MKKFLLVTLLSAIAMTFAGCEKRDHYEVNKTENVKMHSYIEKQSDDALMYWYTYTMMSGGHPTTYYTNSSRPITDFGSATSTFKSSIGGPSNLPVTVKSSLASSKEQPEKEVEVEKDAEQLEADKADAELKEQQEEHQEEHSEESSHESAEHSDSHQEAESTSSESSSGESSSSSDSGSSSSSE